MVHRRVKGRSPRLRKGIMLVLPLVLIISGVSIGIGASRGQTQNSSSIGSCGIPDSTLQLANLVQHDSRFVSAEKGMSYALQYSYTQGPETGVLGGRIVSTGTKVEPNGTSSEGSEIVGGTPIYYPPSTVLVFYSYGASSTTYCVNDVRRNIGIVGVLDVNVPQNPDGSSKLANMTLDYSAGLNVNGTAIQG